MPSLATSSQVEGFDVDRQSHQFRMQFLHVVAGRALGYLEREQAGDTHRRVGCFQYQEGSILRIEPFHEAISSGGTRTRQ
jgi:hypothetical protein